MSITLTVIGKVDPTNIEVREDEIREELEGYDMDIVETCQILACRASKRITWTLDEDSVKKVREIGLKMIEEMKEKLG